MTMRRGTDTHERAIMNANALQPDCPTYCYSSYGEPGEECEEDDESLATFECMLLASGNNCVNGGECVKFNGNAFIVCPYICTPIDRENT